MLVALDSTQGLMTDDIRRKIEGGNSDTINTALWNELIIDGRDIEHIISVADSMYDASCSNKLRDLYRSAILDLSQKTLASLPAQNLYSVLADIHFNAGSDEELAFFATLNYEDFLERTLTTHHRATIDYRIAGTGPKTTKKRRIVVYKLHGSFNWENQRPVRVADMLKLESYQTLWIPPGVDKHRGNYPFNVLWGHFTEALMSCDVLRVVGCSLSRNDWSLIPLLYSVQKLAERKSPLSIEMIAGVQTATAVQQAYSYLDLKSICECEEVATVWKTKFKRSSPAEIREHMDTHFSNKSTNHFAEWLDAKIEHILEVEKRTMRNARLARDYYYRT